MERVAFLIEDSGERIGCLLNPESVVMRRQAGVRPRESAGGMVAGTNLADDPLICTGGGRTELTLDLLFDVTISGSTITTKDVRDLTRLIWDLAENNHHDSDYGRLSLCRFVWGKSWNISGIVTAVAERLEYFDVGGVPRRSWLRLRMLRVLDTAVAKPYNRVLPSLSFGSPQPGLRSAGERIEGHRVSGGGEVDGGTDQFPGERIDQIASRYYGNPSAWRLLASFNNIDDPLHISAGQLLQIPTVSDLAGTL